MQKKARPMTEQSMRSATWMSARRVQDLLKLAQKLQDDPQQEQRLAAQRCKACFYFTAMGGAAMTTQPCMSCGVDQQYSSTNTSAMCASCAESGNLCRHCGGDIGMDMGRQAWPKAYSESAP
ncbi:hypothetical protein ABIC83_002886 [Roseateles asaccharophilus]|uniref:hypothetical protein n=1 Tax=Roseateles asaccharophilus TaxID=582607 RepID=UPI003833E5E8